MFRKIPERLIYSLIAIFSLSLSIFFRKKALLIGIPPLELLLQFIVISAIILTLNLFLFQKKYFKKIKKITQLQWCFIFFAGIFLLAAFSFCLFGLRLTTSVNYSFITRSSLIFTTILAYFFLKEKMPREKLLLIFSFFIGIYLVTTGGKIIIPQVGDLLILIGAFSFSSFSIVQKKLSTHLPPEVVSWGVTSSSAILAILTGFLLKVNFCPTNGFIFILLIGSAEALMILFMNKTMRIADVTYYVMMTMLIPILNGFLGFIFLNELLNFIQILGGFILIISGILVQRLKS